MKNLTKFVFLITFPACQTAQVSKVDNLIQNIQKQTLIPKEFKTIEGTNKILSVPLDILTTGNALYGVELREAPNKYASILDQTLAPNENFILLSKAKNWIKVYSLKSRISGWIPASSVSFETKISKIENIELDRDILSLVFSSKEVKEIYSFADKKPIFVNIPKGHFFYAFKINKDFNLILLDENNSLAWARSSDIY